MFWDNFVNLCDQQKKSPNKVASEIGCSSGSITAWKQGRLPRKSTLVQIADYFDVTVEELLGKNDTNTGNIFVNEDIVNMEIIGSVKAGYDGLAYEERTGETTPVPTAFFKGGDKNDFFLLRVNGNSMYPKMIDGDLVLVHRTTSVDSGTIAVILYGNNEATIKTVNYVYGENWLDLVPANPEYQTRHIEGTDLENCRILGRVVKLIRDLQ